MRTSVAAAAGATFIARHPVLKKKVTDLSSISIIVKVVVFAPKNAR
jgi:hypothetical protein